ncbi:MAG: WXG100 family type VII secretion target [Nocardioides sp.]|uniref:WXG100 family type VII secretion target n=1 Tax=Nocardioides sp. TaxID=35761 RepID=UPI0039E44D70
MSNVAQEMGQGHATLSRSAAKVAEAQQDLQVLAQRLSAQLAGVTGQWVGAGGSAFLRLHQEWARQHQVITGALAELEAALRRTEQDNMATDQAQAEPMTNLSARLAG